jgi:hypothetical protein
MAADHPMRPRIEAWRSKQTGNWVNGTPYSYTAADALRIEYDRSGRGHGYFIIHKWPQKPNLSTREQTEFIDKMLPRYMNPYETNSYDDSRA